MKKYLKTIEDIEALRNTDTKIYFERSGGYAQFVNGWPCRFYSSGDVLFGYGMFLSDRPYIEVPDEPCKSWIGKLGWVSDRDAKDRIRLGILKRYSQGAAFPYEEYGDNYWAYFTPLTPEEVEKYTGYKVVEED